MACLIFKTTQVFLHGMAHSSEIISKIWNGVIMNNKLEHVHIGQAMQ